MIPFPVSRLSALAVRRPWLMLGVIAVVSALALARIGHISLRTSNLDLIDPELPEVHRFLDFAEAFGTPNALVVVFEGDDSEALKRAVDKAAPLLRARPDVRAVVERLPYDREFLQENELDEYIATLDASMFFVFVQPTDTRSNTTELAPFVAGVRQVLQDAGIEADGVHVGLTGIPKYALDDQEIIQRDLSVLSLLALVLIGLLFALAFRSVAGPLAATLSLLVGFGISLGFVSFVPGHLTILSAMFASMIFGLGIDYGIHIAHHVEELRLKGLKRAEAVEKALRELQSPLNSAVFTTAGVFFILPFSGFKGFAELGVIAGVSLLVCYLMMYSLLPALLVLWPGGGIRPRVGASRIGALLMKAQGSWQGPLLLASVVAAAFFGFPKFDGNYLNLQPKNSEAVRLEQRMVDSSDYSPYFAVFVRDNKTAARELAEQLRENPVVAEVRSLTDLDYLFEDGEAPPTPREFEGLFRDGKGRYAVYAYPEGDVWDTEHNKAFLSAMHAIDPNATGMPFLGDFMIQRSKRALVVTGLLALIILPMVAYWDFRDWRKTAVAVVPPLLAIFWMAVLMHLLGLAFNPLNVMAVPIVLGIAVDDAVHIVHRFYEERGDLKKTLHGAGRAVVLTTLTTLAAFGSVLFTSHRGLQHFSAALCLGVGSALVVSVIVLPWLLVRMEKGRGMTQAAPRAEVA